MEQNTKPITLEHACEQYMPAENIFSESDRDYVRLHHASFKAGAQWQKEQYFGIVNALEECIHLLREEGYREYPDYCENELKKINA